MMRRMLAQLGEQQSKICKSRVRFPCILLYFFLKGEVKDMEISNDELMRALELIRNTCKSNENCNTCPLRTSNWISCDVINSRPEDWILVNDQEKFPRLFK